MAQEKYFENKVKDFLHAHMCWFVKYWGGGEYTRSGVPDLLVCSHGQFIGIEVKAPKGRPSWLQIRNLQRIRDAGGYAILLYPKDFNHLQRIIWYIGCDAKEELKTELVYFDDILKEWELYYRRKGV